MKLIDLTGKRFDHWLVLSRAPNKGKSTRWLCQCDCGRVYPVHALQITRGRSTGCIKCRHRKPLDEKQVISLRRRGLSWDAIAARTGISKRTLQRRTGHLFDRMRYDGRLQRARRYDEVARARDAGMTWDAIAATLPFASGQVLQNAFVRESSRRLWDRLEKETPRYRVLQLTDAGRSARAIAAELGISERNVVRWRKLYPLLASLRALDVNRIARLRERDLGWGDINARLGGPFRFGAELEVAYNFALDLQAETA